MTTFLFFAAAGVALGIFFNAYALQACCLAVALISIMAATRVGLAQGAIYAGCGLLLLQIGYFVGMVASDLVSPRKAVADPAPHA